MASLLGVMAPAAGAQWTVVYLHPTGSLGSHARAGDAGTQVGENIVGPAWHASLWSGTAASWVDLHPATGPDTSECWGAGGGQQVGRARIAGIWRASL